MTDNRLLTCAKLIKGNKAVDVGTDHGYLSVYLVKEGICSEVVACDVNEKPLQSARKTVAKAGLQDKIDIVLSDGLDNIDQNGVTDVVMAGMGGELIVRLIEKCAWLRDAQNLVNLVLQPMTKSQTLRKWLYDNGFYVGEELACIDGAFVYSVMQAEYIGKKPDYACDSRYLYGGRVRADDEAGRGYLEKQAQRLKVAGEGMLRSDDKQELGRDMLKTAEDLLRGF